MPDLHDATADWTYLDHAAATPLDDTVRTAMEPFLTAQFYNPSATYAPAREVARSLLAARTSVAHWLGARPAEVIFTAGGTESDNLAIRGTMDNLIKQYADANLVVSAIEHEAVLRPAGQYDCRLAPVDGQGVVDLDALRGLIDGKTVLVSIMYANNEIGTVQPLREVSRLLQTVRDERRRAGNARPLLLHSDACQAANYMDMHAARMGADMITINGGKLYGPKQSGVLYVRGGLVLQPQVLGGGQEYGLRSGTENIAGAVGLATALELAQNTRRMEAARLQELQQLFLEHVTAQLPATRVNGSLKKRLPNNVHITLTGHDNERLILELEARGVLAAAGSACSASSGEPSHVLRAIGLSDDEARASLRFTMGRSTSEHDVRRCVAALADIVDDDRS